jgi:FKBP-type peptidyl-prolyl cis-trans isomerase FklB
MKLKLTISLAVVALAYNATAQSGSPPPKPTNMPTIAAQHAPVTMPDPDTLGTAMGVYFGEMAKREHFDINADQLANAMKEVLANRAVTNMNERAANLIMMQWQGAISARRTADRTKLATENKVKGDEFMATNAKAPGIITLTNGVQYKVLVEGKGDLADATNLCTLNYKGTIPDGTVFDENDHFTCQVKNPSNRYKAWADIIPLMRVGSKYQVFVPPDLGLGPIPRSPKVPPNSMLIFEIELLSLSPLHTAPSMGTASAIPVTSSQIIKVPSAEEMKKGAKIEVITNMPSSK